MKVVDLIDVIDIGGERVVEEIIILCGVVRERYGSEELVQTAQQPPS